VCENMLQHMLVGMAVLRMTSIIVVDGRNMLGHRKSILMLTFPFQTERQQHRFVLEGRISMFARKVGA
jgi:hypothetical protein